MLGGRRCLAGEVGWVSGPVVPGVHGDFLKLLDELLVGGQNVVEVVANSDKSEASLDGFFDTISSEEEETSDLVVLLAGSQELVNGLVQFWRGVHVREFVLLEKSHRHGQIISAEESDVDMRVGEDFIDVVDAGLGLDLDGDDGLLVGGTDIAEKTGVVGASQREVDGSRSVVLAWLWEEAAAGGLIDLGSGVDVRNQNSVRSSVERLLDSESVGVALDSDKAEGMALVDGRDLVRETLIIERSMLGINQQPIVGADTELFSDHRRVRIDEQTHLGLVVLQLSLELLTGDSARHLLIIHLFATLVWICDSLPPKKLNCSEA